MPSPSFYVICGSNILMLLLSLVYFRRCRMTRPLVGVLSLTDVIIAVFIIVFAHFLYVVLPLWAAIGLFALAVLSALYYTLEPLFRVRSLALLMGIVLIALDIGAARRAICLTPYPFFSTIRLIGPTNGSAMHIYA